MKGITIHGHNINNLRYADDTALVATSQNDLQEIVTKVKVESGRAGLDMNVKKTKTMIISRDPERKKVEIKVNNETLQQVDKFTYLGTQIREDAKTDKELDRRINIAKERFGSMSKLLTTNRLKLTTKLRILKCYIYSIFTYGSEAWTLTKALEKRVEAFEMWCLRRIGNISWRDKLKNEKVLDKLGTKRQLLNDIQSRKLKYFGHIKRKNNILTTLTEGKLEGKRPRGRPRGNWFANIKEWTNRTAYECTRLASNRHLWSVISRQPSNRDDDTPR